jgi:hypothetical protein
MTAPERIYMDGDIEVGEGHWSRCFETPKPCIDPAIEYVRSDLHDATKAQLAKAVEALRFYAPREVDGITFTGNDDAGARARSVLAEIEKGGV